MSSTSTAYNDYKRNKQKCTSRVGTFKNSNYADSFRRRGEIDEDISGQRSNERVLDDLSTFIAEFSYLTDGQDSKPKTQTNPIRSYNAYLVEPPENDENVFYKRSSKKPYQDDYHHPRKSVEWIDQIKRNPERKRSSFEIYSETPVETSDVGRPHISRKPRDKDYIFEQLKKRPPNQRFKIRKLDDGNGYMRPRSKLIRYDDGKLVRVRIESSERNKKLPYQKVRRIKSKSQVRYLPFRYERKKYRTVKPQVRRGKIIPHKKKEEITSESPTVITLYPKNAKGKQPQKDSDDFDFLADPDLPCKCFKCMKKYELLQEISKDKPNTLYFKPKNEFQSVSEGDDDALPQPKTLLKQPVKRVCMKTRSSHIILHPKTSNKIENNSFHQETLRNNCCCNTKQRNHTQFHNSICGFPNNLVHHTIPPTNQICLPKQIVEDCCRPCQIYEPYTNMRCHKLTPCPYPCEDNVFMSNWNLNEIGSCDEQIEESRCKSVYFRFDCVGHQINPAVTQFFHSILNNKVY